MASQEEHQPHFIIIPLMGQGHMIPLLDMARLLAQRGTIVTFVTTTLNAARFRATIDRAVESGLQIRLLQLHFPCLEVGLPEGCENTDTLPQSQDMLKRFYAAINMLQQPIEQFLQEQYPPPSCIISGFGISWTVETARKFHIPALMFLGFSCFSHLCSHNIYQHKLHESITSDSEPFVVPGLPHQIEVTKAQLPRSFITQDPELQLLRDKTIAAWATAYGVVINSFDELEPEYVHLYGEASSGKKIWPLGPVSLCNKVTLDKFDRGRKASISEELCLEWLNSRKLKSVIYVCFGSMCRFTTSQLIEIGLGLEASKHSFIWAIRMNEQSTEIEKWLSEGFEQRVMGRGLIIRGWAPQILILSHPSTGGFLTHCGWNSTLEAICAGVPMIAWPLSAEQFFNERMVVHVLEIGVSMGVKVGVRLGEDESLRDFLKMEEVRKAVERLMEEGEEGEQRRSRAREFGEKASRAMEKGGSSYNNMEHMIQRIMAYSANE